MSQLYSKTKSDTSVQTMTKGGHRYLSTTFLHGGAKNSQQAIKVTMQYRPEDERTHVMIEGPDGEDLIHWVFQSDGQFESV
ncbi:MAG: hypothetical protein ACXABY_02495 [Candidatus Thorarchaeota archaeon]|jgi:hypothetical protein